MGCCIRRSPQTSDSRIRNSGGRIEKEERERERENGSKVDAFSMEQDESGSDEAAVEGNDTSCGLAEWVNSRKLLTRRRRRRCKKTSAPTQGKIGEDEDAPSCH